MEPRQRWFSYSRTRESSLQVSNKERPVFVFLFNPSALQEALMGSFYLHWRESNAKLIQDPNLSQVKTLLLFSFSLTPLPPYGQAGNRGSGERTKLWDKEPGTSDWVPINVSAFKAAANSLISSSFGFPFIYSTGKGIGTRVEDMKPRKGRRGFLDSLSFQFTIIDSSFVFLFNTGSGEGRFRFSSSFIFVSSPFNQCLFHCKL